MRRVLAILGAAMLLFATVGGAAANAPFRETDHTHDAGCFDLATPLGTAEFSGFSSELFGSDAFLTVWAGEPGNSDIVLDRDFDQPATVTFGATTVSMSIPLVPSGTATVQGTLTPVDTIDNDDRFHDGNTTFRQSSVGTVFTVDGTLTLPGVASPIPFGGESCSGTEQQTSTFTTQPHSFVTSFTGQGGSCDLVNDQGGTANLFLGFEPDFASIDGSATGGGVTVGVSGAGDLVGGAASFPVTEFDPDTGEDLGTTGTADLTLVDTGEVFTFTLLTSNGFQRVRASIVDVDGTLTTSVGTFSLDACVATMDDVKSVDRPSNGPKPGGKRPANDLPSGAIPVKAGYKATVATRGAQMPSEAGYPCLVFEDFDGTLITVPVEYTVWYTVAGTGGSVTVDTAGSDFDTVIGVYAGSPTTAANVACLDDTPLDPVGRTLQGNVTFPTTVGTTYWIQLGGLDEDVFGPDPFVPYGNLKVAIR